MYQAGIEGILGLRREGKFLVLHPCIPVAWPGFEATVVIETARYDIVVDNGSGRGSGVADAKIDGVTVNSVNGSLRLPLDGEHHTVAIFL